MLIARLTLRCGGRRAVGVKLGRQLPIFWEANFIVLADKYIKMIYNFFELL
jgi:hypothetical protein